MSSPAVQRAGEQGERLTSGSYSSDGEKGKQQLRKDEAQAREAGREGSRKREMKRAELPFIPCPAPGCVPDLFYYLILATTFHEAVGLSSFYK